MALRRLPDPPFSIEDVPTREYLHEVLGELDRVMQVFVVKPASREPFVFDNVVVSNSTRVSLSGSTTNVGKVRDTVITLIVQLKNAGILA